MPPNSIADALPEDWKRILADENVKIGSVFKFYCNIAKKEKRFILAGFKYDKSEVALIHINTEINGNIFPTVALKNEHLELIHDNTRDYLNHTSYANCSQIIKYSASDIKDILIKKPEAHLGVLSDVDYKLLKEKIASSKILRKDVRKEFGLSFP